VRSLPEHATNRGYTIGDVEAEVPVEIIRAGGGHMSVHFSESGHEKAIGTVNDFGTPGNRYLVDRPKRSDYTIGHHDCLLLDDRLCRHWHNVHVYECSRLRRNGWRKQDRRDSYYTFN
jgi:hypothetical protein